MKVEDALQELRDYYDNGNPSEDDEFRFTEALGYLIKETKDPKYMCELGWHYCSKKRFDLEIKYLEMAAEYKYLPAIEELGYMWYYGQHGEQDYEKAFHYFSMGAGEVNEDGNLWCRYKLADMYRFGLYVEKDEQKYRDMIEDAYKYVSDDGYLNEPFPEISYRLAGIRVEEGKKKEAVELLKRAKRFMAERLSYEAFWGHIEVMGRIVRMLYELIPFDEKDFDFYDLFYLTDKPGKIAFKRDKKKYRIEVSDDNDHAIGFEGRWYRNFNEFCEKGELGKEQITNIYDEFYDLEVAE